MNRLYGQNFGNKNAFTAFIRDNNNHNCYNDVSYGDYRDNNTKIFIP